MTYVLSCGPNPGLMTGLPASIWYSKACPRISLARGRARASEAIPPPTSLSARVRNITSLRANGVCFPCSCFYGPLKRGVGMWDVKRSGRRRINRSRREGKLVWMFLPTKARFSTHMKVRRHSFRAVDYLIPRDLCTLLALFQESSLGQLRFP